MGPFVFFVLIHNIKLCYVVCFNFSTAECFSDCILPLGRQSWPVHLRLPFSGPGSEHGAVRKTEHDSKKNTFQLKKACLLIGNGLNLRFALTLSYSADKQPHPRVFGWSSQQKSTRLIFKLKRCIWHSSICQHFLGRKYAARSNRKRHTVFKLSADTETLSTPFSKLYKIDVLISELDRDLCIFTVAYRSN